jgi:hypothetical protein
VFDSGGVTQETQSFTTRYFPLTSAVLDASRVLVAGVDADGLSVIELWNLGWPAVMPAPAIGVGGSGPQSVNVVLPQRSVVRIYQAAASGLDFVANMTALRRSAGDPVQALVQFRPSLDIHVLDIPAGTLTLLASGTSGGGQLGQVPELQQHYFNHFYSKQHVSSGFVYFLVEQRRHANAVQRPPALLFFDTDMNGTLDSHATVQAVDFYGPGLWSDSAQYVEWWK